MKRYVMITFDIYIYSQSRRFKGNFNFHLSLSYIHTYISFQGVARRTFFLADNLYENIFRKHLHGYFHRYIV